MRIAPLIRPPLGMSWFGYVMAAVLIAVVLGVVATYSLPAAVGLLAISVLLYLFGRSSYRTEVLVGVYWLSFCLYETVLTGTTVSGFFYPFYVLFAASMLIGMATGRTRIHMPSVLLYVAFLVVVLVSFVGFGSSVSFEVIQRLIAYGFGLLVAVQCMSERGLYAILVGSILGSSSVAAWVIEASIRSGFAYRAGIDVNQNNVTVMVAIGLIPAVAILLRQFSGRPRNGWIIGGLLMAVAGMTYAVALLASRGMTLSIAIAIAVVGLRLVTLRPRALIPLLLILIASTSVLLLPGGTSILERFEEENISTANNRSGLWETTLQDYMAGNVYNFLFGFGYDSNKDLLRQEFGWTTSTHNAYLQILYEFGLVGLLVFVGLLLLLLLRAWRSTTPIGLVMLGLTAFLLGANLSSNAPNGFVFWLTLGFVIGIATWDNRVVKLPPRSGHRPAPAATLSRSRGL